MQQNNDGLHAGNATQQTIIELGWEVLPHAAYSPDFSLPRLSLLSLHATLQWFQIIEKFLQESIKSETESFFHGGRQNLAYIYCHVIEIEENTLITE